MRDDMAKVVTERPRRGHRNTSKKTGVRIRRYDPDAEYDDGVRQPISRGRQYGWNAKEFSDLINCYIGTDRLAYSNNRSRHRGEWPFDGLYVDPRTGRVREQRRQARSRSA